MEENNETEITISYTHLRHGLAELVLSDYLQSILFEPEMSADKITKEIQEVLSSLLGFQTIIENVHVHEDGRADGTIKVNLAPGEYSEMRFTVIPTGQIFI